MFFFPLPFYNRLTVFQQRMFPLWNWKKFKITKSPFLLSKLKKSIYQFLLLPKFINFFSSLFLSIPPLFYFYQFRFLLISINFSSIPNLSIPSFPYIYQFLLLLIFICYRDIYLIFINSSYSLFLSIPPLYFYQFLLLFIFVNFFPFLFLTIPTSLF